MPRDTYLLYGRCPFVVLLFCFVKWTRTRATGPARVTSPSARSARYSEGVVGAAVESCRRYKPLQLSGTANGVAQQRESQLFVLSIYNAKDL